MDEQNKSQILETIQNLQATEKTLYQHLEDNVSNNILTPAQKNEIIEEINKVAQIRINLYKTLGDLNAYYAANLTASAKLLVEQSVAANIVERELNEAKRRLEAVQKEKLNKLRLVEINSYYGQRYGEHAQLMKIIIVVFVPIMILSFLASRGFIPTSIYYGLVILIGFVGSIFIFNKLLMINDRDNMNYQEFNWYFDPSKAPKPITGSASGTTTEANPWYKPAVACVGELCCSTGSVWDASLNVCVVKPSTAPVAVEGFGNMGVCLYTIDDKDNQSFINHVLSQYTVGKNLPKLDNNVVLGVNVRDAIPKNNNPNCECSRLLP
jgi:hypothetical protein